MLCPIKGVQNLYDREFSISKGVILPFCMLTTLQVWIACMGLDLLL